MVRTPPRSTLTDPLFPCTPLFRSRRQRDGALRSPCRRAPLSGSAAAGEAAPPGEDRKRRPPRSEEHTSELQSLMRISYAVFCLKKKNHKRHNMNVIHSYITIYPVTSIQC